MSCLYCQKPGRFRCSKCKGVYCGVICQKADYPTHKNKCADPLFTSSEQEQGVYNRMMDSVIGHNNTDGFVLSIIRRSGDYHVDFLTFAENAAEMKKLRADKVLTDLWLAKIRANENPDLLFAIIIKELSGGEWQCVPIEITAPRPASVSPEKNQELAQEAVGEHPDGTLPVCP